MINFIKSIPLFAGPYAFTLLSAAILGITGVIFLARRQLFVAAAVGQASVFGFGLFALVAGATALEGGAFGRDVVVVGAGMAAALVMMLGVGHSRWADGDERAAWVFVACGAGSVLVLARAPAGMEQLRRLQASSVITATTQDVLVFAVILVVLIGLLAMHRRALIVLLSDPVMAAAVGMRLWRWNLALALICGFSLGMAVRSGGTVVTLGLLALPAMIAKQFCGEIQRLFWMAPTVGVVVAVLGLWQSYTLNLPPGQVITVLLAALALPAYLLRAAWDRNGLKLRQAHWPEAPESKPKDQLMAQTRPERDA